MAPERVQQVVEQSAAIAYNPEAIFHWLIGTLVGAVTAAATWAVKAVWRHDKTIAVMQKQREGDLDLQVARHEETLRNFEDVREMLQEIRDRL